MAFYSQKTVAGSFEPIRQRLIDLLQEEGFGIQSEIDVQATLKKKLNVEFRNYRILGACNPNFAYKAIQLEENIGVLLPCNFLLQEHETGKIQVSVINPRESMKVVENNELGVVAEEVVAKLTAVLERL